MEYEEAQTCSGFFDGILTIRPGRSPTLKTRSREHGNPSSRPQSFYCYCSSSTTTNNQPPPPPRRPLPLITTSTTHVSHNSQECTHEAEAFSGSWASSAWFGATYRSSSPALGSPTLCFEVWADLCFMVLVSRGSCLSAKQSTAPDPFSQLGCSREAHEHRCVDRHRCACQGLIAIRPLVN